MQFNARFSEVSEKKDMVDLDVTSSGGTAADDEGF